MTKHYRRYVTFGSAGYNGLPPDASVPGTVRGAVLCPVVPHNILMLCYVIHREGPAVGREMFRKYNNKGGGWQH